mgnify:CR=1 FL=1
MSRDLSSLYQKVILQHDRQPFHFQKMEAADVTLQAYNPVCGDQFQLFLKIENNQIQEAHFHGYGCAISKASTSILIKKIQNLPFSNIQQLLEQFQKIVSSEVEESDEELAAFQAARQFPERLQCATLSWKALEQFIKSKKN